MRASSRTLADYLTGLAISLVLLVMVAGYFIMGGGVVGRHTPTAYEVGSLSGVSRIFLPSAHWVESR
jgi:hypothetical protein